MFQYIFFIVALHSFVMLQYFISRCCTIFFAMLGNGTRSGTGGVARMAARMAAQRGNGPPRWAWADALARIAVNQIVTLRVVGRDRIVTLRALSRTVPGRCVGIESNGVEVRPDARSRRASRR
jgi:hypothetical protein